MDWFILLTVFLAKGTKVLTPSRNIGALIVPAIIILCVLVIVFIFHYMFKGYLLIRKNSEEWENLEKLFKKIGLSAEETSFIRSRLRKMGYSNPTTVLKEKADFEKFRRKILKRRSHHREFLLEMVRQKAFKNQVYISKSKSSDSSSTPSKTQPSL